MKIRKTRPNQTSGFLMNMPGNYQKAICCESTDSLGGVPGLSYFMGGGEMKKYVTCENCDGKGKRKGYDENDKCPACNGVGIIPAEDQIS